MVTLMANDSTWSAFRHRSLIPLLLFVDPNSYLAESLRLSRDSKQQRSV